MESESKRLQAIAKAIEEKAWKRCAEREAAAKARTGTLVETLVTIMIVPRGIDNKDVRATSIVAGYKAISCA